MKFKIEGKCKKCKNNKFLLIKNTNGKSKYEVAMRETLCHDGFGYDLNTFDITCSKCGSVNEDCFEIKGVENGK